MLWKKSFRHTDTENAEMAHNLRVLSASVNHQFTIHSSVKRLRAMFLFLFLSSLLFVPGCQKSAIEPVALAPEDVCAFCKIAISEKRYAAEFIDRDDQPFKFDDISCMFNFIKREKNKDRTAAYFVTDYDTRQWTKADDAFYVQSP